jgi:alanine or glycine:cation symporter, AGCS family
MNGDLMKLITPSLLAACVLMCASFASAQPTDSAPSAPSTEVKSTEVSKKALDREAAFRAIAKIAKQPPKSIDAKISETVGKVTGPFVATIFHSVDFAGTKVPLIVGWLVIAALIFTLFFGFIQLRGVKHAVELVRGDFSNPNDKGEVSHFQALTTALSGTVGLGNITGVAVAVSIGGPGATFWMILAGLLGMASKFCECTLGVKYRRENEDGSVSGGPMYYLSRGFMDNSDSPALHVLGKVLAVMFAVFCILGSLGGGNMFQANQAHEQLVGIGLGAEGWMTGIVMAIVVFAVIVGGIKSIANVTEKIVPVMAVIYVVAAGIIIIMNLEKVPFAVGEIFRGAFTDVGVAGGIVGALIQGFKRAAFSNEAGVGSAAIAHSAVKTSEPITEGIVSLLEPFVDTVVICTMTALVIIITGQLQMHDSGMYMVEAGKIATVGKLSGVALTSRAFESAFSWFPYVLAIAVVLFAFSTMISWSYYGLKAWTYLFGESKPVQLSFKIIFCLFVVIGAATKLGPVIDFSDAAIFAMALVNIIGLYILMPRVKQELVSYLSRLKNGEFKRYRK